MSHCLPQVRRAIDWLGDKGEARRYAAALILQQLAENAPAVFNVHVRAFIDAIWNGLRDPKQLVREASVAALRVSAHACGAPPQANMLHVQHSAN